MARSDGVLVPLDEYMNHQISDTFATVQQSDRSWTEKVCLSVGANDGSLQLGFGLGKYLNRNVMDAYAGVSRGVEQWTVRASRQLMPAPDSYSVGPIHYEIVEALKKIRIRLESNAEQPIAFDILLDCSALPPVMEAHEFRRQFGGYRIDNDLARYHQMGTPSGWIEVEGRRHSVDPVNWYCSRDHSWGVRYGVGAEPTDIMPGIDQELFPMHFLWSPMRMVRPDGSVYGIHHFYLDIPVPGVPTIVQGGLEFTDGSQQAFTEIRPELRYNPANRRLQGGELICTLADGAEHVLMIEVVSDTGYQLGAGLYFGLDGRHHGQWLGALHTDGEYIADCSTPEAARRLHQLRDCLICVRDGDAVGHANYQTVINGEWLELGLRGDDSFI